MTGDQHKEIIDKFADLALKVGLNLQPGQRLLIWVNQLELAPLARTIVSKAYQAGSPLVSVLWNDDEVLKARFEHAPRDSFDEYPAWKTEARLRSMQNGDAFIWMGGDPPDLLKGFDPNLVSTAAQAYARLISPVRDLIAKNAAQWLVICPPTMGWAQAVFPALSAVEAEARLWEAVARTCRLDTPQPDQSWKENLDGLQRRGEYLSQRQYQSLHFRAPGTDLEVGMPRGHIWIGGWDRTPDGVQFCPNIPTEEVFSMPHRERVNGTVRATMPLSYQGSLIEDFQLEFKNGKVVDFSAGSGQEALQGILETGPNALYLGEVALVPYSSPISQEGIVFLNTLYDENASCHLALGNAYRVNLEGGTEMTDEEFAAAGGNQSLVHVDFMFGSEEMDVDGLLPDGSSEPVMRKGEWAF
ncbi:MAG: aminopeptidase [Anaerolineales bacterium]